MNVLLLTALMVICQDRYVASFNRNVNQCKTNCDSTARYLRSRWNSQLVLKFTHKCYFKCQNPQTLRPQTFPPTRNTPRWTPRRTTPRRTTPRRTTPWRTTAWRTTPRRTTPRRTTPRRTTARRTTPRRTTPRRTTPRRTTAWRTTQAPPRPSQSCGEAQPLPRVIGGVDAQECEFPWMVIVSNGETMCGGTILDRYHVMSAAHCFHRLSDYSLIFKASDITVSIGSSLFSNLKGQRVSKFVLHPGHTESTNDFDVAIITLQTPLTFTSCVRPICLPDNVPDISNMDYCIVAGWGATAWKRPGSPNLKKVRLPLVDQQVCMNRFNVYYNFINELKFCAGDYEKGGIDACSGDSGGPYMCERNGVWYQFGITSFGVKCGLPTLPGIYTKVSNPKVLQFIKTQISFQ